MTPTFVEEARVRELVSLHEVIDALEDVLAREAEGQADNIAKTMATWDLGSSAHALGGVDLVEGLVAFKTWVNTPRGAQAVLTLHAWRRAGWPIPPPTSWR